MAGTNSKQYIHFPKMILKYVPVLFVLTSITISNSQQADDACFNVPLIDNYDVTKQLGPWYVQELGEEDDFQPKCYKYKLVRVGNNNTFTEQLLGNKQLIKDNKTPLYTFSQVGNTSEYTIQWKGKTRQFWTIATDYKSFATWYLCIPEENDKGTLFMETRARMPTEATMEKAREAARKVGFKLTKPYLKKIDYSTCNI